ncbi:L-threonylcarbamoyladenylate synthase [uncultured Pseudacidovorax sp.]|uniref:L-threonylcarbamoyladenylate synthase n=1 Tax=uncultured Pseudacidovorax sp. TaxID=679313 RepID=UPI0025FAF601|nr:L-threonylcarbamoyladenylate synthase [uncultured Pseudacidovorax sp.]
MILDGQDSHAIERAALALRAGELVAFPTETVYGLGADAANDDATRGIFRAKGRPSDHPLIVHLPDGLRQAESLSRFAQPLPAFGRALADAFWPGPLTLIATRQPGVGAAAAGGQDTIGLRCPDHPVAQALLHACARHGVPGLAGPSANRFGRVSPTTAAHVAGEFGEDLLIVDGGPCTVGIESTIVDCSRGAPVLLRPGVITRAQIERVAGERLRSQSELAQPDPRASGTLESHYAPTAKVRLMDGRMLQSALDVLGAQAAHIAVWSRTPLKSRSQRLILRRMPDDATETARQLFALLRQFDDEGAKLIWIETPPDGPEWEGVRDRLMRAAA